MTNLPRDQGYVINIFGHSKINVYFGFEFILITKVELKQTTLTLDRFKLVSTLLLLFIQMLIFHFDISIILLRNS